MFVGCNLFANSRPKDMPFSVILGCTVGTHPPSVFRRSLYAATLTIALRWEGFRPSADSL
jgi:hypothetical protein